MNYNYAIILVLIILIIGYYLYSSVTSAAANRSNLASGNPGGSPGGDPGNSPLVCTGTQICVTTNTCDTPPAATPMFEFLFEYKHGRTYQQFADVSLDDSGTNSNHLMVIEDTSQKSIGSGILYQYFNPSCSGNSMCNATSKSPYAMLICPSTYSAGNTGNITINKYIGVVVNYTFVSSSLPYTKANVMNPNNKKIITQNITDPLATTSSFLGVCDLTSWYNSLTIAGHTDLVGVYVPNSTLPTINGKTAINPWISDMNIINDSSDTIYNNTTSVPYGVTVTSYLINSLSTSPPYNVLYF